MTELARVDVEQRGDLCLVHIRGEVDISNARELSAAVEAAIENRTPRIAIDLTETTYLDSAGVQLLFLLADRLQVRRHQLQLIVPAESAIRAVLELTSLPKVVPVESHLDEGR
jgi:anti-anti-sigma factor